MTFDLTPEQQALCTRARSVAARVDDAMAAAIDEQGAIPNAVRKAVSDSLADPFAAGAVAAVLAVEALTVASAGLGAAVGLGVVGGTPLAASATWPGLRGAEHAVAVAELASGADAGRARLMACAVAVGIGRAAVTHAVEAMKTAGVRPASDETTPHWAVADAATEVEGGRLLTIRAAQCIERGEDVHDALSLARGLANGAAERAVAAAIRVVGPSGYQCGSLLERLSRDARTLSLILAGRG